jgi:hypothetical protein
MKGLRRNEDAWSNPSGYLKKEKQNSQQQRCKEIKLLLQKHLKKLLMV